MTSASSADARQEVLDVLREHLLRPGAVTDGFHGLDVIDHSPGADRHLPRAAPPGLTVLFRWRADPTTYAVTLPVTLDDAGAIDQLEGPDGWPGYPVSSAEDLAQEASFLLMEELDTGLVRRAPRVSSPPTVHLLLGAAPDVTPAGFFVGALHLVDDGAQPAGSEHLRHVGLDVRAAQRASEEQRLVTWLHAYVNNDRGEPVVGHAALGWEEGSVHGPGGTVRVEALQVLPRWPVSVAQALLFNALRNAAEAGARLALAGPEVIRDWEHVLQEAGFVREGGGTGWVLSLQAQRWPDLTV